MQLPAQIDLLQRRRAWLDNVQNLLRARCPAAITNTFNVVNVENDTLIVSVPTQAQATQLRWMLPTLQLALEQDVQGYRGRITSIKLQVRDPNQKKNVPIGPAKYQLPPRIAHAPTVRRPCADTSTTKRRRRWQRP